MAKYKIPDQSKLKNIGVGWGGEMPKHKIIKEFQKESGVPKKMPRKMAKFNKIATKKGF